MALKLGELLINEGLLTTGQLEEALKCQVIFGIKLGSSLIELGFIEENRLTALLSRKLGVPAVTRNELMEIPHSVYSLLPSTIAEQYRVLPFKLENRRLSVAMADPSDFKAIDELSFVTGFIIQPFIAPDINISFAL
jgi:Type II secretion system (T2SS), protein E, N-terminal domain